MQAYISTVNNFTVKGLFTLSASGSEVKRSNDRPKDERTLDVNGP